MEFVIEHGMLQAKDVNPAAAGESTPELTNPRTEAAEDIKQDLHNHSPLQATARYACDNTFAAEDKQNYHGHYHNSGSRH